MLVVGQEWTSPDGRSAVRVVELSPERAVIERVLRPGSGRAAAHVHRDWDKSYEAVDGELRMQVGKEEPRLLAVGEAVQVPRGVVHVDPWNESATPAVVRYHVSPVTPAVHVLFGTLGELLASGQLDSQDGFTLPQLAAVLRAGHADSWGAQPPIPVQRVAFRCSPRSRGHEGSGRRLPDGAHRKADAPRAGRARAEILDGEYILPAITKAR